MDNMDNTIRWEMSNPDYTGPSRQDSVGELTRRLEFLARRRPTDFAGEE